MTDGNDVMIEVVFLRNKATGPAPNVRITILHGEIIAIDVKLQRPEVEDTNAETIVAVTDVVVAVETTEVVIAEVEVVVDTNAEKIVAATDVEATAETTEVEIAEGVAVVDTNAETIVAATDVEGTAETTEVETDEAIVETITAADHHVENTKEVTTEGHPKEVQESPVVGVLRTNEVLVVAEIPRGVFI
ncbi:MAG: hypothetical protein VX473_05365 [Candidatus Thermoplasmatota archaeon]|nr:hypothetical protein [Candidatus Thermoplasmatota archaeon]